jgi:DNA (cytosine-5)-methyltransferase 1
MKQLVASGRAPNLIVLENVCGALTSHGGKDFNALCGAFVEQGYSVGAIVVDAALFLPQSRPRLFVIGVRGESPPTPELKSTAPTAPWHPKALVSAYERLPSATKSRWVWWNLPAPTRRVKTLSEIVERAPNDVPWHDPDETKKLLSMMSELHRQRVDTVKRTGVLTVGSIYRRTRRSELGDKVQRAEVRFDETAGCLRTPAGGSSRQILLFVEGERVRTRLISARETARLMGLRDDYILPKRYNEAYHLTGDGVAVPVVSHISEGLLLPLLGRSEASRLIA